MALVALVALLRLATQGETRKKKKTSGLCFLENSNLTSVCLVAGRLGLRSRVRSSILESNGTFFLSRQLTPSRHQFTDFLGPKVIRSDKSTNESYFLF